MITLYVKKPFQTTYSIKTNSKKLADLLQTEYGKYIEKSEKKADFEIEAIEDNKIFEIKTSERTLKTEYPLYAVSDIFFDNTKYDKSIFALHGSAVEFKNKAYLFLAATTGGKTTLASYLTSSGFGYITDDCILLDRNDFKIYPHTNPIHLRHGGFQVLQKHGISLSKIELLDNMIEKRYVYTPENSVKKAVPLSKIFFIKRIDNQNKTEEMTTTEKMTELLKSPITIYDINGDYLRFISKLAKTDCQKLFYCDMEYVSETIKNEL